MDYQFSKLNIINELSVDDKAYRERVMEKYKMDDRLLDISLFILGGIIVALIIILFTCLFSSDAPSSFYPAYFYTSLLLLCLLLFKTDLLEKFLNVLGLIDTTRETKKTINLMEMQIALEGVLKGILINKTNPVGYEITNKMFRVCRYNFGNYLTYTYILKNLISGDVTEKELEVEISTVVKNCFVKVPTIDIAKAQLLIPADEKGNVLLEEQDSQSLDSN